MVEYLTLSRNDPVDNVTARQQCDNLLRILIDLYSRLSKRAVILTCQRWRVNTPSTTDGQSLAPRPLGNSHGFVIDPVSLEARKGGPVAVVEEGICFRSLPNTVRPSLRSVTRKIPARADFEDAPLQGDAGHAPQVHQACRIGLG